MAYRDVLRSTKAWIAYASHPAASNPGRVGINDMPNEILLKVIRYVSISGSAGGRLAGSLADVALCSRRFNLLTEPILYEELKESHESADATYTNLCLRKLLLRPDLARRVRRFTATHLRDVSPRPLEFAGEGWEQISKAAIKQFERNGEDPRWITGVKRGRWAAIISLIISLTPNLEEVEFFDLEGTHLDYMPLLDVFHRARILQDTHKESPFSLSKLRKVSVNYADINDFFDLAIPILMLKSVESFHSYMTCEENPEDVVIDDWQMVLATKDLRIERCDIKHENIFSFLKCFMRLERFYYEFEIWADTFEVEELIRALEQFKTCLSDLTILMKERYLEAPRGNSLAEFEVLASVKVNAGILIGRRPHDYENFPEPENLVDIVPPTLQSLSLIECDDRIVKHIFSLVSQKAVRTPCLHKLDLGWEGIRYPGEESPRFPELHPGFTEDEAKRLIAECEAASIDLAIKYSPPRSKFVRFKKPGEPVPVPSGKRFVYPYDGYEECCAENGYETDAGLSYYPLSCTLSHTYVGHLDSFP